LFRLVRPRGRTKLVLNLTNVTALGASALGVFIRLRQRLRAAGGALCLCGLRPAGREIFATTRLDTLFPLYPGEADALAAV
jgi:anti-anti-sigma factor